MHANIMKFVELSLTLHRLLGKFKTIHNIMKHAS